MINRVVLVGRLARDPELRSTSTGKSVCDFSIAVQKRVKPQDGPDADFFRIQCWGSTADYVANYLHKGRLVAIDGRMQTRKYTTTDGENREVVEIVADNVQGLDRPKDDLGGQALADAVKSTVTKPVDEYDPFADEQP